MEAETPIWLHAWCRVTRMAKRQNGYIRH